MVDEQKYYREITPSGFGIAIKIKDILFSTQSKYQKIEVLEDLYDYPFSILLTK